MVMELMRGRRGEREGGAGACVGVIRIEPGDDRMRRIKVMPVKGRNQTHSSSVGAPQKSRNACTDGMRSTGRVCETDAEVASAHTWVQSPVVLAVHSMACVGRSTVSHPSHRP
jgi:hypothetical protein